MGWVGRGRFVSAHRPNVSNCLLSPFFFFLSEGKMEGSRKKKGEKKVFLLFVFVYKRALFFLFPVPSLKRIRETKQTQTHVHTHTQADTHIQEEPCNKKFEKNKIKFRRRLPEARKREEKKEKSTNCCCWFLLLTFSHSLPLPPPPDGLCLYDTLKRLFYVLTSS